MSIESRSIETGGSSAIHVYSELNKILSSHKHELLSPKTVSQIPDNWSEIRPEFDASYIQKNLYSGKIISNYGSVLKSIKNNKYYFNEYINGKLNPDYKTMYDSGVLYRSYRGGTYKNYEEHGICKYTLGSCTYTVAGKTMKVKTEFKDGVWYRNITGFGPNKKTRAVYDKYGLLLFSHVTGNNSSFSINFMTIRNFKENVKNKEIRVRLD